MNFIDFGTSVVLPAFVAGGSAWALLTFLGEKIVGQRLQKDLERYKTELGARTDVLKTQLAIFSHEQNVATSRVDVQRADAIHKVFACVRAVINPMSNIVGGCPIVNGTVGQSNEYYFECAEHAHAACGQLVTTLSDLAIYFDNETYSEVMRFAESSMNAAAHYLDDLRRLWSQSADASVLLQAAETNRPPLIAAMKEFIQPQASKLVGLFRIQLGIEATSVTASRNA